MSNINKKEKILREGINKWKNFLKEGAFNKVNENNPPKASDGYYIHPGRTPVRVVSGSLKGAEGKAIEITTSTTGETAIVIELTKDADRKLFGQVSDEVIVLPGDVETIGTDMADDPKMDYYNDMPSRDGELREGGSMGEYGKMDAEQGLPPTKIGRGNEEYMAAYNAVLQARGEEPMDIQQPDQAYLDALRSGKLEEGDAGFKVGDKVIANGYPGTITDLSIPGMATVDLGRQGETTVSLSDVEMMGDDYVGASPTREGAGHDESILQAQNQGVAFIRGKDDKAAGKEKDPNYSEESGRNPLEVLFYNAGYNSELSENFSAKTEGKNPAMNLQSKAKGKAMGLLQTAKAMAQAPSTEPARGFAAAVAKDAGEIVDLMVELEGFQAAGYMEESAWGSGATGGMEHAANLVKDARDAIDRLLDREYELTSDNADWEMIVKGLTEALYIISKPEASPTRESNEPFDMDAHMAAYENEPETIEYRKQIKQLVQMVADKKGIPVEQAAEEIASYVVTAQGMKEAIGMQNIEKRRKPAAAPAGQKLSPTKMAMNFMKEKGYDSSKINVMDLIDHLRSARAKSQEEVNTAVIDFIQKNNISMKEGAGDKEARIRDVVKMGSWDNIDGVPLSLPQAELLVAAMNNLNDTNKKKLMAMPIDKMLDIVNKMVDAGVITVNYGRAGLKEYGDHDAQASGGLVHSTYSSDPELDQIADIAADKKDWGLLSISKALKEQGFDTSLSGGVLVVDGKYFIGKEEKFDIGPDEEIRRIEGTSLVVGYMG